MIICSCNVLSDAAVRDCLARDAHRPRTPAQVQRCLGCSPRCGCCAVTIRAIITAANAPELALAACACACCGQAGCACSATREWREERAAA